MNNFYYAQSLLETLYGITLDEDDFSEIALVGWNLIGNKRTKLYRYSACTKDKEIQLPCNCDQLEAITANFEDFEPTSNIDRFHHGAFGIEQYIEHNKHFQEPLYAKGKFVNYELVGDTLYFQHDCRVNILYRGLVVDDEGLPEISDKEARALATYCAYITKFKEGIATNNGNIVNMANMLQQQWLVQCDQARTDFKWTQNDYDEILDARTCFDRKIYNKSFKLIR